MDSDPASKTALPVPADQVGQWLRELQDRIRARIVAGRGEGAMSAVSREAASDTIYALDAEVEPLVEEMIEEWSRRVTLAVVCEGLEEAMADSTARGPSARPGPRVYPRGTPLAEAQMWLLLDPIDGTRGLMYDKRSAWSLGAAAPGIPQLGRPPRLRDLVVSVMTELPTSKMDRADVLWAIRGRGVDARRHDLRDGSSRTITLRPSTAEDLEHGFASVSSFFPGAKVQAAELMEHIAARLAGSSHAAGSSPAAGSQQAGRAAQMIFDDQYISTGGQWYALAMGQDRFIADLRPVFLEAAGRPQSLCCHPYDCAGLVVAEEAGVILTDAAGRPLDGPLDVTSSVSWIGYANVALQGRLEPAVREFLGRQER